MSVFTSDVTVEAGSTNIPVTVGNFPATQPISGSVSVSNFPATQPVSGTVTANAGTGNFTVVQPTGTNLHVVVDSGSITTTSGMGATATITRVATSSASVLLLAANASRKRAVIMTETGTANYVAFATTATQTAYTYLLGATTVLEVSNYTGAISLIRNSGTGNVQVTEIV